MIMGNYTWGGLFFTIALALIAIGSRKHEKLKGFSFTLWVFTAVSAAMFFPQYVGQIGGRSTQPWIVPLIQVTMFGMGTALSLSGLAAVASKPKPVLIGLLCQFTIMPVLGFAIATMFPFPPEVAAGVVLVGTAPPAVASNLMTFFARGNLALAVSLTTVATLIAPLVTPFMMKILAGQFVEVSFVAMMLSMVKMILLPISLALIVNRLLTGRADWILKRMPNVSMVALIIVIAFITAAGRDALMTMGLLIFAAVLLHNGLGFLLGYWGARLFGMNEEDRRTVAIVVGMQNSGLSGGIAASMGKAGTMGLASVIFSSWHNISGSILANWWRNRPPTEDGRVTGQRTESNDRATVG